MTLTTFVRKNSFRNLRRSILTVLSIGFSLLLLTLMMAIWRNFYMSKGNGRVRPAAGDAAQGVPDFFHAELLPRKDPCAFPELR